MQAESPPIRPLLFGKTLSNLIDTAHDRLRNEDCGRI